MSIKLSLDGLKDSMDESDTSSEFDLDDWRSNKKDFSIDKRTDVNDNNLKFNKDLCTEFQSNITYANSKIIEQSKNIRSLNAKLNSSNQKNLDLMKILQHKEKELNKLHELTNSDSKPLNKEDLSKNIQQLKELMKSKDVQLAELRGQNQVLLKEVRFATKMLQSETGENFDAILNCIKYGKNINSEMNWRGRQQKIIHLQDQLKNVEKKLKTFQLDAQNKSLMKDNELPLESENGATSIGLEYFEMINSSDLSLLEQKNFQNSTSLKERRLNDENVEKLNLEVESLKHKLSNSRARNEVLTKDMERLKNQLQVLLNKTNNDDELIETLVEQNNVLKNRMKTAVEETNKNTERMNEENRKFRIQNDKLTDEINQIKNVLDLKNAKIEDLNQKNSDYYLRSDFHAQFPENESPKSQRPQSKTLKQQTKQFENELLMIKNLLVNTEDRCNNLISEKIQLEQTLKKYKKRIDILENAYKNQSKITSKIDTGLKKSNNSNMTLIKSERNRIELINNEEQISEVLMKDMPESSKQIFSDFLENLRVQIQANREETIALKVALKNSSDSRRNDLELFSKLLEQIHGDFNKAQTLRNHLSEIC